MTRRPAVVKVQIARKELGLAEDDYRAILLRLTGQTSSAECNDAELGRVLDEFKAKGWTPKVVAGGRKARKPQSQKGRPIAPADHPAAKKARALWLSLWNLGEIRDPSETALEAFARRQLKVERLQWADQGQTYKLIEALKAMAERAGWSQDVTGLLPGADAVRVLMVNLIRAQETRLYGRAGFVGHAFPHEYLDTLIRRQGEEIRCLPENAR
ncbi:regulatory protein GemA [Brevundimonas vitis]|uniref:Regulatory protein GemA n=1 Tax=Brevundimonas vitisensis TaxID=2800818 RepID=A0ABX7BW16_9CAUL|nr:regulatory protein GemA [Brevundimonas vitisensis]QQQ19695.1 regulatory protein GemA [Brevundimonas vitisensis]